MCVPVTSVGGRGKQTFPLLFLYLSLLIREEAWVERWHKLGLGAISDARSKGITRFVALCFKS